MPGDASLARLFRDYAGRWEIERVERGNEWVACRGAAAWPGSRAPRAKLVRLTGPVSQT